MSRNVLGLPDRVAIHDDLKGWLLKTDGGWVYDGDEGDASVAERMTRQLGKTVTIANVQGVRKEMFGRLAKEPTLDSNEAMRRIAALEDQVQLLSVTLARLCAELGADFGGTGQ